MFSIHCTAVYIAGISEIKKLLNVKGGLIVLWWPGERMTEFNTKGVVSAGQDEPSPDRRFLANQVYRYS